MIRVRFAPSPTGFLHVGGARTALFNFLFARRNGGKFILRIDDTDLERSETRFEEDILASLRWLGLDWDEGVEQGGDKGPYRQSEKLVRYQEAAEQLRCSGAAVMDPEGVLRLSYHGQQVSFLDQVCGAVEFSSESLGTPPALLRSDGSPTYHLASVVDDIDMQISHIIRGQDHLTNTAKHVLMIEALGYPVPVFAHLPLILGEDGSKMSKRNTESMVSVCDFRREGFLPEALNNFLVLLGWSHPQGQELLTLEECIDKFDFSRVGSTAAVFDTNKLNYLNGYWLRHVTPERLAAAGSEFLGDKLEIIESRGSQYWERALDSLRSGFASLKDIGPLATLLTDEELDLGADARSYIHETVQPDRFLEIARRFSEVVEMPEFAGDSECLTEAEFEQCLAALRKDYKKEKGMLYKTIRICLTGTTSGYELKALAPYIPRSLLVSRARAVSRVIEQELLTGPIQNCSPLGANLSGYCSVEVSKKV